MATLTRRKKSCRETSKVSTPDIENSRTALDSNAKSDSTGLTKINIFLFLTALFLSFSTLSKGEFLTPNRIATNPLFHKYVTTAYGEDKYIRLLDIMGITLVDGGKETITEVKAETSVTPASDTTLNMEPKVEPKVEPKTSATKIDTNIVKVTENTSLFCPDCAFDDATMGKTTCLQRAQFFMEKYGLSEEYSKTSVMRVEPTNCVNKAPSYCPDCLFNAATMGKTTCLERAQFFMEKYGVSEEDSKRSVMIAEPANCAMDT